MFTVEARKTPVIKFYGGIKRKGGNAMGVLGSLLRERKPPISGLGSGGLSFVLG